MFALATRVEAIASTLGFDRKDKAVFQKQFDSIDIDCSGQVSCLELLMRLDIERTPFSRKVFSIFDADGNGEVDLAEFTAASNDS